MNDDEVWDAYAKGVKKIKKKKLPLKEASSRRKPGSSEPIRESFLPDITNANIRWIPAYAGMTQEKNLDRRIERDLRQGDIALEARIDLHGMTQEKAYATLAAFLETQTKRGHRHLLVITGKGRGGAGVLRTSLPGWLQSLPQAAQILALRPAAPKHGGDGAFYVLLRKKKPAASKSS